MKGTGIWKNALRCLTCMNRQTHCFVLVNKNYKANVPKCKHAVVYLFVRVGFLWVVYNCFIGCLMRKCWHHISLFTVTSHLAQWFVNPLCSFSLEVVRGRQSDFYFFFLAGEGAQSPPQTSPLLLNILAFFSETHPKQSLCHCKCIIAQVKSAWMSACFWAWGNYQS